MKEQVYYDESVDSAIIKYLEICEKRKQKAAEKKHLVHAFMIYQCEKCNAVYIMWLEKGLEDKENDALTGNHKPVPFCITCPECYGIVKHTCCSIGMNCVPDGYRELKSDENFFLNDENEQCGIPIIFKKDFDILTPRELGQIMYLFYRDPSVEIIGEEIEPLKSFLDGFNRKDRRHPERFYDSGYKRPRKGQKINHWM